MNRPLLVTLLLIAVACTSSEPGQHGTWSIEELSREALGRLADKKGDEPNASPGEAFAAESEEVEESLPDDAAFDGPPTTAAVEKSEEGEPKPIRTWKRSQLVPNASQLSIGTKEELPLEETHVEVRVDGFRARVKLDLFYRNDREQQLQGTLKLRLPDGARPTATAFGVRAPAAPDSPEPTEATLKHARIVPREKAAHAYEQTVRRKIDPALVEWAGAGIYSVKVFPLEPGKLHQVSITYDVDLSPAGDGLEYRLDLPEKAGKVSVDIEVHAKQHTVNGALSPAGNRYRWTKPTERTFVVRVANPGAIALTGSDPATGDLYAVRFTPELPVEAGATSESAIFLLDTSLSSNPSRFNIWLDLMEAVLMRNRDSIREFRVGCFNIGTHWWRSEATPNTSENVRRALAYAKTLALEGATDIGNALDACAAIPGSHDLFLLSDGAATWGVRDTNILQARVPKSCTIFAYRTGLEGTDTATLERIARQSGGAVFSVAGKDALDAAATAHTNRPWTIVGTSGPGADLLLSGRPTDVFPGQTLIATGRGKLESAITLSLRQGGRALDVQVTPDETIASPLTAGVYGGAAVSQLEEFGALTEATAKSYALHFGVVGKSCSLLMLETDEDYAEFKIDLPHERDAVRSQPASETIKAAVRQRATAFEDPKAQLTAWLVRLESMPGMSFKQNEHVRRALADVTPSKERTVHETPARLWSELPGTIQEQLASRKLDYGAIVAEAKRRKDSDGMRALSSLVEENPGDLDLARDVGYTAMTWGRGADVASLFRVLAEKRPYEPSSYLAMAECLEQSGDLGLAKLWYEVALAGEWDQQYGAFQEVATVHYLSFLRRHKDDRLETLVPATKTTAADLIVTVFWTTDRSDVDLYVRDADGEVCSYNHTTTRMGGRITKDATEGFGPEMFVLEKAKPGEYAAWVNYFSEDDTQASTRTRVFATVIENWGREGEQAHPRIVELATGKASHPIALMKRR